MSVVQANYAIIQAIYAIEISVSTTKTVRKPNVVTPKKPMWKPTGRHFTLYASSPLTRILEPIDEPVELTPSDSFVMEDLKSHSDNTAWSTSDVTRNSQRATRVNFRVKTSQSVTRTYPVGKVEKGKEDLV
nr:hypothetical protein [Tanacetum cinerariifolium]